ncbi:CMRF35-like molecule 1 [Camelus dromedarius]|uniref:CMRF35-like molecule 1 n=1 Tax=Camelus dromedarius TaxID=9838 RepID=A0A5N4D526_CAMDR|nr:CMRF35-like molecule 1 [Camelus dromedarius]
MWISGLGIPLEHIAPNKDDKQAFEQLQRIVTYAGSAAITGPKAVSGLERDSLTVQCQYGPGWELYVKWWCRGADWDSCKFVVKTTGSEQEVKKDRVSIKDNQKNRSFTVTMEKLRLNDADTYWCGIERAGTDLGVQVEVTVDPVTTHCHYGPGWENYVKWWCRDTDQNNCIILVQATGSKQGENTNSVYINQSKRMLTMTMSDEKNGL